MKRLLSIEFQKIWKNKASKFLLLTYFILLSFIALIASIKFNIGTFEISIADQGIFNFPYIWHFNTYIAAWFKFFLAIIIVSMMANEYTYGTLKQNLIDGLSKKEFILSKFLPSKYSILDCNSESNKDFLSSSSFAKMRRSDIIWSFPKEIFLEGAGNTLIDCM